MLLDRFDLVPMRVYHQKASLTQIIEVKLTPIFSLAILLSQPLAGWEPGSSQPEAATGLSVDSESRNDVVSFFHCIYGASEGQNSTIAWNGSVANCQSGTTSADFKNDVLRRINWFRAMAGVPADITFSTSWNASSQDAALMMSSNAKLNHSPPTSWTCYTDSGATAAGAGNLALGSYGIPAINGYVEDPGAQNTAVGHRRWILAPRVQGMGTGDIPPNNGNRASNCLRVIGDNRSPRLPAMVSAWPPKGFVPWETVYERWSYSYTGADFSSANVVVTHQGGTVNLTVESRTDNGFGDNTIVWNAPSTVGQVTEDETYTVTISNIQGDGPSSVSYDVTIIDPNRLTTELVVDGPSEIPESGGEFTFNGIESASNYELSVSQVSPNTTVEGAEDATSAFIIDGAVGHDLRITSGRRSGAKCFQLNPPDFNQSEYFELERNFLTEAASTLRFYVREGFATSTTVLNCQVSSDGGSSWTSVWSKAGRQSADSTYQQVDLSLAAYQNQSIRLKFEVNHLGGSRYTSTGASLGFRIDDISISNSSIEVPTGLSELGQAEQFSLNAGTTGNPLTAGETYLLKVRPTIGCRTFGYSSPFAITIIEEEGEPGFCRLARQFSRP